MRQKTRGGKRRILKLRALRRSREMTQETLAGKIGVSKAFICEVEKGKYHPSLDKALALAGVFGVSVEEAFSYVEVPA